MKRHAKPFDSVRMMRGIRDRLSRQFRGKTVAEQRRLIRAGLSRAATSRHERRRSRRLGERPQIDLRRECDFASMARGVRGKYVKKYRAGTNFVLLEPDLAEAFPSDEAVNEALRALLTATRVVRQAASQPRTPLRVRRRKNAIRRQRHSGSGEAALP